MSDFYSWPFFVFVKKRYIANPLAYFHTDNPPIPSFDKEGFCFIIVTFDYYWCVFFPSFVAIYFVTFVNNISICIFWTAVPILILIRSDLSRRRAAIYIYIPSKSPFEKGRLLWWGFFRLDLLMSDFYSLTFFLSSSKKVHCKSFGIFSYRQSTHTLLW